MSTFFPLLNKAHSQHRAKLALATCFIVSSAFGATPIAATEITTHSNLQAQWQENRCDDLSCQRETLIQSNEAGNGDNCVVDAPAGHQLYGNSNIHAALTAGTMSRADDAADKGVLFASSLFWLFTHSSKGKPA
jgi:hypothetical protein